MSWTLEFDPGVLKDLEQTDRQDQRFILDSLDTVAGSYSASFASALLQSGKLRKLHGPWKRLLRLRLRSGRVIYREHGTSLVIRVVRVGHGRQVYL